MACSRPGVRRGQLRGAKPRVQAEGSLFHPGTTGEGKTGRVNVSEPSMLPRHRRDPRMGCWSGSRRTGRCEAAGAGGGGALHRVSTAVPGSRGHPIRSHLACAERDNPVGVRRDVGRRRLADREEGRCPQRAKDDPRSERRQPKGDGNPGQHDQTPTGRLGQPAG
jgi:hypothetical protein